MLRQLFLISGLILFLNGHAISATRIFFEGFENTTYNEHPFEEFYGSSYQAYWEGFKSNISQSSNSPHSGNYCLTHDPLVTRNPHGPIGLGGGVYGNTSDWAIGSYHNRRWYFRWYQRWERNIDWDGTMNKIIHVNQNSNNEGTSLTVMREGTKTFHITLRNNGNIIVNKWRSPSVDTIDDMQWHLNELYIDYGTNNNNAELSVKFDGEQIYHGTNLSMHGIDSNPVKFIDGWPSNISGNTTPGGRTMRTWYDDLEIYTLNGPNDIPPLGGQSAGNAPSAPQGFRKVN